MSQFVVLEEVGTSFDAQLIVGLLKQAGIPYATDPEGPVDEFTMSQHLLGQGIRILVPEDELEGARAILAEVRSNPPDPESLPWNEGMPAASEPLPSGVRDWRNGTLVVLLIAVGILGWMKLRDLEEDAAWEGEDPLYTTAWERDRWVYRWKHNGKLSSEILDENRDGIIDESRVYDRNGALLAVDFDDDGDGTFDRGLTNNAAGALAYTWVDEDGNDIVDWRDYPLADGRIERWLDMDQDRRFDVIQILSASQKDVLAQYDRVAGGGFVKKDLSK